MKSHRRLLIVSLFLAVSTLTALFLVTGCGGSNSGGTSFGNGNGGDQTANESSSSGASSGSATGGSSGNTGGSSGGGGTTGGSSGSSGSSSGGSGGGASDGGAPSSGGSSDASTPATPHGTSTCLKAGSGDYSKAGPYMVATKANIDLSVTGDLPTGPDAGPTTATAFYPSDLNDNCPHPIVSWANGTGVTGSTTYSFFNNNAASWGIVVMAADNPNSAGGNLGGFGGGSNGGPFNRAGIDYLLKANNDSSSIFYHHLSTRAGVAGHSQGAFAATLATQHPNVEAEVQVEGGGVPKAGIDFLALTGSADNVVGTMSPMSSYTSATGPSMFAEYTGADHVTTPTAGGYFQMNPGTIQFMRFYTAWWRCFLADDQTACAMFKGGASCGVCKDPNWTSLQTKNM
jgi:hypothetical protein